MNKDKLILAACGVTTGYLLSSLLRKAGLNTELMLMFYIGLCVGSGFTYFFALWQLTSDRYTRTKLAMSMVLGVIIGLSVFVAIIIYIIQTTPTYL